MKSRTPLPKSKPFVRIAAPVLASAVIALSTTACALTYDGVFPGPDAGDAGEPGVDAGISAASEDAGDVGGPVDAGVSVGSDDAGEPGLDGGS